MEMTMTDLQPHQILKISKYLASIRCATKRDYANRYLIWLRGGKNGSEPSYTCSAMAAQGVRFALYDMVPGSR